MADELRLVIQFAVILIAAGVFTILSKALKQPPILGYIIAGFLVGPHLGLFEQFDAASVHQWSELGIIFLMFGLGLEFSFKKLIKIGSSALITAGTICVGMFIIGVLTGHLLHWTTMECIFLGGLTGMSSTTIIIKAYGDMGLKDKPYASLIFGSLVFEDLIAVLMMVLLSTLAVTGKFSGVEMLKGLVKLVFFLILWFVVGMYLIPLVLKKARKYLDEEILLLVGIGLCFGMVVLANSVGFSSALGAFVMGSILAETIEGEIISRVTKNVGSLFGAIFFVSVGMMVNPEIIAQQWSTILILTLVAVCGILFFSTSGALLAGKGLDTAVHTGFTMAQLGEFSFIIAGLGCSLGVMRDFINPVIISVSVITTFTTPFMIKLGDPVYNWLDRVIPGRIRQKMEPEESIRESGKAEINIWRQLIRKSMLRILLFLVILTAIIIGSNNFLGNLVGSVFHLQGAVAKWACCIITLMMMAPFLYLMLKNGSEAQSLADLLLKKNPTYRWPLNAMAVLRALLVVALPVYIISHYITLSWWGFLVAAIAIISVLRLSRNAMKRFDRMESTFLGNFSEKEEHERKMAPITSLVNRNLAEYSVTTYRTTISPEFTFVGKSLREMPFRKTSGVNIIKILRGTRSILVPSGSECIFPGDTLVAVGTREQLDSFRKIIDENSVKTADNDNEDENFIVEKILLGKDSIMTGRSLKDLNMRSSGCMVISVFRDNKLISNPDAAFIFKEDDYVWIAGIKENLDWYR